MNQNETKITKDTKKIQIKQKEIQIKPQPSTKTVKIVLKSSTTQQLKETTNTETTNTETTKTTKNQKNSKHLKPLIKWSGGKSDEIPLFEKYIPIDYDYYLEPFIGGGALFFHLNPKKAVISDIHPELIDFYTAIKQSKSTDIYTYMKNNPNNEQQYYQVRDNTTIKDYLDNAKRFYYLRKTCFRGMSRYNKSGKFNIPFGRYKTLNYEDLKNPEYENLLKHTEILLADFTTIFTNPTYNTKKNFMFLDPPYDSEFTDYGYCKFGQPEHTTLANLFKTTKIRCLMIIGKTPFISKLYENYIVAEFDKKYKFKIHSGRVGDEINTKHLIIKNY